MLMIHLAGGQSFLQLPADLPSSPPLGKTCRFYVDSVRLTNPQGNWPGPVMEVCTHPDSAGIAVFRSVHLTCVYDQLFLDGYFFPKFSVHSVSDTARTAVNSSDAPFYCAKSLFDRLGQFAIKPIVAFLLLRVIIYDGGTEVVHCLSVPQSDNDLLTMRGQGVAYASWESEILHYIVDWLRQHYPDDAKLLSQTCSISWQVTRIDHCIADRVWRSRAPEDLECRKVPRRTVRLGRIKLKASESSQ